MKGLFDDDGGAQFSACGRYRYLLRRQWASGPTVNFVMLNPSTADATTNDPTVERCSRRARQLGFGGLVVTNLFAWRSTSPRDLVLAFGQLGLAEVVGPDNDHAISKAADNAAMVICAWGNFGGLGQREQRVTELLAHRPTFALRVTGAGQPQHPLYLPYNLQPQRWNIVGDPRPKHHAL